MTDSKRQQSTWFHRLVKLFIGIGVFGINASSIYGLKASPTKLSQPPSIPEASESRLSRRKLLLSSVTTTTAAAAFFLPTNPAHAARAKGAAELDLEFYVRDLVSGNKKEGSIEPSKNGPPVPPPRTLKGAILPMLLNKECTSDCVPIQALVQIIQDQDKAAGRSVASEDSIVKDIQSKVDAIRERTKNSFFGKAPWKEEEVSDQYYFDFTIYALWKAAAQLIENNENRDRFMRNIGRLLVSKLQNEKLLTPGNLGKDGALVSSIPEIMELLSIFKTSGYCKSFRIRSSDDAGYDGPVFDELDDESLSMVGQANCLVSIYEPATLGASLQINGENSRFAPDFVGTCLSAIWESYGGIRTTWDVFFVDPEYRPNPKDYFPNEQLLQMTLNKK